MFLAVSIDKFGCLDSCQVAELDMLVFYLPCTFGFCFYLSELRICLFLHKPCYKPNIVSSLSPDYPDPKKSLTIVKKRKVKHMQIFQAHRIWTERICPNSPELQTYIISLMIIHILSHLTDCLYINIYTPFLICENCETQFHASLLGQVGTKHVKYKMMIT